MAHVIHFGSPLQSIVTDSMNICSNSSDGIAIGSGAGGTPPYSYEWFDNNFISFSTNDTAFNLSAGSYYLEVSDANGCDTFSTVQVISPQTALSGSPQVFGVACRGDNTGMIVGDATGSWAPYRYVWINNLGDTLQQTSYMTGRDTLDNLSAGVYNLHVYDAQDCFVSYGLSVGEPNTSLSIDSISVLQNITCYGDSDGSARMYISGGMPNYTYLWDSGETGTIAQNLSSGYRHVSLTDDWGCVVSDSIYISENPEIVPTVSLVQTVSCYGDSDDSSGVFTDTLSSYLGCDSIVTIDLTLFSCIGCMDPLALNYDPTATVDDGSCTYTSNCTSPKPDGLYAYDVIDTRAKVGWNNMNDSTVWFGNTL